MDAVSVEGLASLVNLGRIAARRASLRLSFRCCHVQVRLKFIVSVKSISSSQLVDVRSRLLGVWNMEVDPVGSREHAGFGLP